MNPAQQMIDKTKHSKQELNHMKDMLLNML